MTIDKLAKAIYNAEDPISNIWKTVDSVGFFKQEAISLTNKFRKLKMHLRASGSSTQRSKRAQDVTQKLETLSEGLHHVTSVFHKLARNSAQHSAAAWFVFFLKRLWERNESPAVCNDMSSAKPLFEDFWGNYHWHLRQKDESGKPSVVRKCGWTA